MLDIGSGIILSIIVLFLWALLAHDNQYDYEYMEEQIRKRKEQGYD